MAKTTKKLPVKSKSKTKQTTTRAKSTSLNKPSVLKKWTMIPTVLAVALVGYFVVSSSFASSRISKLRITEAPRTFIDISSPQCGSLGAIGHYSFGIVGLNGSRENFNVNGCLGQELSHFNSYDLYVGANYRSAECSRRKISSPYSCGVAAGQYNLNTITFFRLRPGTLWIDVEDNGGNWTGSQQDNRSFLSGMEDTLRRKGYRVAYYSTGRKWDQITGGAKHSTSNWYTIGGGTKAAALNACRDSRKRFAGSRNVYMQWWQQTTGGRLQDYDIQCP